LIDVRSDVYSLGVILYTLLTGQYHYDVSGPTLEALRNIQEIEPERPRRIDPKFNSEMEAILLTALAKKREDRYQSAADFKSDIENWLAGRPIRVKSISTAYLLRKIISRHRYTSTVAALLAVIILAFAFTSFTLYKRSESALQYAEVKMRDSARTAGADTARLRQMAFALFLEAWNVDHAKLAEFWANTIAPGSGEYRAAAFLLNPAKTVDILPAFERSLANENSAFADFVIAERHRKDGQPQEAKKAYNRCLETLRELQRCGLSIDMWLYTHAQSRLRQIDGSTTEPLETGGPGE
jgi:hypothetical protein